MQNKNSKFKNTKVINPPKAGYKNFALRALRFKFSRGFTIVELLVVIAIIALLVSLTFALLQSTRAKSRDAERESEIKSLQNALTLHIVNNKIFPVYNGTITGNDAVSIQLLNSGALSSVPTDPLNTGDYVYKYNSIDGSTYIITYFLETNNISGKSAGQQTVSP